MQPIKKVSHIREKEILTNPPIIEALLELRWEIQSKGPIMPFEYKTLSAKFHEIIKNDYPYVEVLQNSQVPDEMNPYLPRYRFRVSKNSYPLVQIGPGILTINLDKSNFVSQNKFYNICMDILNRFLKEFEFIKPNFIMIHYIDIFLRKDENIYNFMNGKLNTSFEFSKNIYSKVGIAPNPINIRFENSFKIDSPAGIFSCILRTGKKNKENAIIMDTIFKSENEDMPYILNIGEWMIKTDNFIHDWFYEMIKEYKELW